MEQELDHPLRPLRERLRRLEVEPPDQVDEQERDEEREGDHRRALEAPVEALDAVDEEREQEDEVTTSENDSVPRPPTGASRT